ncbi:MAG: sugar ABC transporter permease [Actinobacteria bacterium]|nr:sugar ABC transporter permease [Actinomycetota bacterium]
MAVEALEGDREQRPATEPRRRLTDDEHRRLARRHRLRRTWKALGFLSPNLVFFTLFLVVPILWLLLTTFQQGGVYGSAEFVGLENWRETFSDSLVTATIRNTLIIAGISIPGLFLFGLGLAMLLRNIGRGGGALRAALYIPVLAPLVIVGALWLFIVHPDFGALNVIFRGIGLDTVNWLGSTGTARATIIMMEIWRGMGFWALFFLAGLLALPHELYEAAHLDGTNPWQRFRHLTLPLLRPRFMFFAIIAIFYALQIFDTVFVMTDGGPASSTATVVWYIFKSIFVYDQAGFGATLSFLLLIVILLLTLAVLRLLRPRWRS